MEFDTKTPPTGAPKPKTNPSESLVGEGKPFKDIDALAKGKIEADTFIEQLKAENASMLAKLTDAEQENLKGSTVAQVLEAVRQLSPQSKPNDPPPGDEGIKPGNQPGLSEDDIASLVQRQLKQNETAKSQTANYDSVREAFVKKYNDPDKARLEYKATADSLGIKESQLDDFARMNPALVKRAAGLEQANAPHQAPSYLDNDHPGDHGQKPPGDEAKDNVWWETQRKAKGNAWYFQPKVQQAYWRDVNALGDSFLKD